RVSRGATTRERHRARRRAAHHEGRRGLRTLRLTHRRPHFAPPGRVPKKSCILLGAHGPLVALSMISWGDRRGPREITRLALRCVFACWGGGDRGGGLEGALLPAVIRRRRLRQRLQPYRGRPECSEGDAERAEALEDTQVDALLRGGEHDEVGVRDEVDHLEL